MRKFEHKPPKTRTMQIIEMEKAKRAGIPYHIEFDARQPRTRTMELTEMNRAKAMGLRFSVEPDPRQPRTATMEIIERERVRRMQPDFGEAIQRRTGQYASRSGQGQQGGGTLAAIIIGAIVAAFILINVSIFASAVLVGVLIFYAVRERIAANQVAKFGAFNEAPEIENINSELNRLCEAAKQIGERGREWGLQSDLDKLFYERDPRAAKLNGELDEIASAVSAVWNRLEQLKQYALSQRSAWESKVQKLSPARSGRNAFAAGLCAYCLTTAILYLVQPQGLLAFSAWVSRFVIRAGAGVEPQHPICHRTEAVASILGIGRRRLRRCDREARN
jgi:hypothetical protein